MYSYIMYSYMKNDQRIIGGSSRSKKKSTPKKAIVKEAEKPKKRR